SLTGFPGLSQIPILRYLFSQTDTEHRETETVFVLIPHIVRSRDYSEQNQAALDVGTANAIELRRVSHAVTAPQVTPASTPSGQAVQVPAQPQTPVKQPANQFPVPETVTPGAATFSFDPGSITQAVGSTFAVNVVLSGAQNAYSVPLQI